MFFACSTFAVSCRHVVYTANNEYYTDMCRISFDDTLAISRTQLLIIGSEKLTRYEH